MKASYLPANLDRVQALVQDGQADGIAVFAVTPERQALYDFSEPFLITGGALFPRRAGAPAFDLDSYAGKTVCTPLKGPLTEFIRAGYPRINFKTVQDYPSALDAVIRGEADAAALNIHVGTALANELFAGKFLIPDKIFLESPLAVATPKARRSGMLGKISRGIAELKREEVYRSILLKWTGSAPI